MQLNHSNVLVRRIQRIPRKELDLFSLARSMESHGNTKTENESFARKSIPHFQTIMEVALETEMQELTLL